MGAPTRIWAMVGSLCLIAFANGVLVGLSVYAVLATALGLVGVDPPPPGYAFLAGSCVGAGTLVLSAIREHRLCTANQAYLPGPLHPITDPEIVRRLERLVRATELETVPALYRVHNPHPNAFAFGRSREEAAIVLTSGLMQDLPEAEQDAVIAHQLARVEDEDIRLVGFADAISGCLAELGSLKDRIFWGPRRILIDLIPFIVVSLIGAALLALFPLEAKDEMNVGEVLVVVLLLLAYLGYLLMFLASAAVSGRGLIFAFLFVTLLGPLTLVEWLLAPPTAFLLSRLVSRQRIYDADWRGAELCGDPTPMIAALEALRAAESATAEGWQGERRFALMVKPLAQGRYEAFVEEFASTHPYISDRIARIEERTVSASPAPAVAP